MRISRGTVGARAGTLGLGQGGGGGFEGEGKSDSGWEGFSNYWGAPGGLLLGTGIWSQLRDGGVVEASELWTGGMRNLV